MLTFLGFVAAGLFGLAVGFIINVVATRLAGSRAMVGPLRCTRSPHALTARQALPIFGYLLQGGKCSACGKRISPAYPLTEAGIAILYVLLYALEGFSLSYFFHAAYLAVLTLVLIIDWKHRDIYLSVIAIGSLIALVGSFVLPGMNVINAVAAAVVAGVFFLVAYLAARAIFRHIEEPLGLGDVFLAVMMGLMLGFPNIVGALVVGPLIAGAVAVLLLISKRSGMGDFMPYGVSLCVAAMLFLMNPGPLAEALHLPALVMVLSEWFSKPF